jgi:hypothetical protein
VKTIVQYFDLIAGLAERSGASSAEIEFDRHSATTGVVDGTLYFFNGSRLEFTERVSIQNHRPVKSIYRYQYLNTDRAVFRYDNAAHHPHLLNFPHHKHIGRETLSAMSRPSSRCWMKCPCC